MAQKLMTMHAAQQRAARYGFHAVPYPNQSNIPGPGAICEKLVCDRCGKAYRPGSVRKIIGHCYASH